jgi:hypothetical protein
MTAVATERFLKQSRDFEVMSLFAFAPYAHHLIRDRDVRPDAELDEMPLS